MRVEESDFKVPEEFAQLSHKYVMSVRHVATLLARTASLGIRPVPLAVLVSDSVR